MEDGDFMLTNRQPTLHKPGMMGHRARVMRSERTIRFHYANCSTFNADFDGDEINLHLPQDHFGRAEGYNIVHADEQFFVPTDGKPLRGLIQVGRPPLPQLLSPAAVPSCCPCCSFQLHPKPDTHTLTLTPTTSLSSRTTLWAAR
jgi:hypothetical protein